MENEGGTVALYHLTQVMFQEMELLQSYLELLLF